MTLPLDLTDPRQDRDVPSGTSAAAVEVEAATAALTIVVHGTPAPQGSKRGFVNPHTGRVAMVESSKKVKPWREAVKHAALDAITRREGTGDPFATIGGPVQLTVVYTLPRPKGHYRTGRNAHLLRDQAPKWPAGKPDGDKLDRACLDAVTDAGVWVDDAQVVVRLSIKTYPDGHPKALPSPGAVIRLTELPSQSTSPQSLREDS